MSNSTTAIQRTLTGDVTDETRVTPDTFLLCDECDDLVLRSNRHDHPHDLDQSESGVDPKTAEAREKVPDDALLDTQTYEVTFHYEFVQTVTVEATTKGEAKSEAEHYADVRDARYIETIHTEKRTIGEESQATIQYLEDHGLLPDDHDVTEADIERVLDAE